MSTWPLPNWEGEILPRIQTKRNKIRVGEKGHEYKQKKRIDLKEIHPTTHLAMQDQFHKIQEKTFN